MCGIFAYVKKNKISQDDILVLINEFSKISHRGPDNCNWVIRPESIYSTVLDSESYIKNFSNINIDDKSTKMLKNQLNVFMGFHRLSINDISEKGNQPFFLNDITMICNGEIYNYKELRDEYGIVLNSNSDCEIIIQLYKKIGFEATIKKLDGVFACILYDSSSDILYAARDPIGVRSLYVGFNDNEYCFCSELKGLSKMNAVEQFKPGCIWDSNTKKYYNYDDIFEYNENINSMSEDIIKKNIIDKFKKAIQKRLISDRPIGCLLSGGLDSSLVASLLSIELKKTNKKLKTFSVGLEGSIDLKYANMVAKFIGSEHHELILSETEMLAGIEQTIYQLETWDTTTIRAGTPMFLLAKYIKKNFDTTVIYSGEGSDEISGSYLYFHNAPDKHSFKNETIRLVKDLSYYDVLRCDKSIAGAGLEVRVPFLDKEFVKFYMNIDPSLKMPSYGKIEKYLLRESFNYDILPSSVLWRVKEGMSDGVSAKEKSWYTIIQYHANLLYTDEYFEEKRKEYVYKPPEFKEALYYREIFNNFFPGREETIPYYWLPKWSGDISEPSARVLSIYK